MSNEKELRPEDIKTINDEFSGDVCDDCKKKISLYFKENWKKIMLRPRKYQIKMAMMLCNKCSARCRKKL